MAFQTENEALSYSLKRYPWLQDFCTYINRPEEELPKTEYYLSCAEIHWIISLAFEDYTLDNAGLVEHMGLKGWKTNEGIPDSGGRILCAEGGGFHIRNCSRHPRSAF